MRCELCFTAGNEREADVVLGWEPMCEFHAEDHTSVVGAFKPGGQRGLGNAAKGCSSASEQP
jgi:hypothetical protein